MTRLWKPLLVILMLVTLGVSALAVTLKDGYTIFNPFDDNPTATKESVSDNRRIEGVRYYLHDDYNISLAIYNHFVRPERLKQFQKYMNAKLAGKAGGDSPFNDSWDSSAGIDSLVDDDLQAFLNGYSSTVRHNGHSLEVSYVGMDNRSTAMGSILGGDTPSGRSYFPHLLRALAPGAYEIDSTFPKSARYRVGMKPNTGREVVWDIRDYTYRYTVVGEYGKPGKVYLSQYPIRINARAEFNYQIYNIFLPKDYQAAAPKPGPGTARTVEVGKPGFTLSFDLSQVLDSTACTTWVQGKPALLSAGLTWTNPKLAKVQARVTFNENGKKVGQLTHTFLRVPAPSDKAFGTDRANFVFTPGSVGPKDYEVIVEPLGFDAAHNSWAKPLRAEARLEVVEVTRKLRFYFTPVAVGSWSNQQSMNAQVLKQFKQDQLTFLKGLYPIPPEDVSDVSASALMFKPEEAMGEYITGVTRMSLLARLEALRQVGEMDYVVGIVPNDWMKDSGVTEPRFPHAELISVDGSSYIDSVLAHETGHLLGFPHNPQDLGAAKGSWIRAKNDFTWKYVNPKNPAIDFMNVDPVNSNTCWVSAQNYQRLLEILMQQ